MFKLCWMIQLTLALVHRTRLIRNKNHFFRRNLWQSNRVKVRVFLILHAYNRCCAHGYRGLSTLLVWDTGCGSLSRKRAEYCVMYAVVMVWCTRHDAIHLVCNTATVLNSNLISCGKWHAVRCTPWVVMFQLLRPFGLWGEWLGI